MTTQIVPSAGNQLQERGILVVSESGLHNRKDLDSVASAGADAVLIGESLMRHPDPKIAITDMFSSL